MSSPAATVPAEQLAERYLDLLKLCLSGRMQSTELQTLDSKLIGHTAVRRVGYRVVSKLLGTVGLEAAHRVPVNTKRRIEGRDWPETAETMIGQRRLDNVQFCVADVIRRGVPGDLIETGVWRGGATILMRGVLEAYQVSDRRVWVADSFQGLPKPDAASFPADTGDRHWKLDVLVVSLDEVKANFAKYGLLDDRVRFLPGWFRDTLPDAPIDSLAVMRLDGDMYGSTMEALVALYPKLSPGGFVIIDDYALAGCRAAVDDFRAQQGISDPLEEIDHTGRFWRRSA